MKRRVVTTGVGLIAPGAANFSEFRDQLSKGRSGLAADPRLAEMRMRCSVSGRLPEFEERFDELVADRERRYFSRFARLGFVAAQEALSHAGPPGEGRGGVWVGTAAGPMTELESSFGRAFSGQRLEHVGHAVCRHMPSFLPSELARRTGASRGGYAISLACTSGLIALERAFDAISDGQLDWALVGAVEEDSPHFWLAFDGLRTLTESADPRRSSCPFDAEASGFVPAGGAAFFFLESEKFARERGARSLARVAGVEAAVGADSSLSPMDLDRSTHLKIVQSTLQSAGLAAEDVDLWLPHALSSPRDGQEVELLADTLKLRETDLWIQTPRDLVGYAVSAAALIDLAAGIVQLEDGLQANRNLNELDDLCRPFADNLIGKPPEVAAHVMLKTSHAFGHGHAAALLEKAD